MFQPPDETPSIPQTDHKLVKNEYFTHTEGGSRLSDQ